MVAQEWEEGPIDSRSSVKKWRFSGENWAVGWNKHGGSMLTNFGFK